MASNGGEKRGPRLGDAASLCAARLRQLCYKWLSQYYVVVSRSCEVNSAINQ